MWAETSEKQCRVQGCNNRHYYSRYCWTHWKMTRNGVEPRPVQKQSTKG